jgi:hypothetical protein
MKNREEELTKGFIKGYRIIPRLNYVLPISTGLYFDPFIDTFFSSTRIEKQCQMGEKRQTIPIAFGLTYMYNARHNKQQQIVDGLRQGTSIWLLHVPFFHLFLSSIALSGVGFFFRTNSPSQLNVKRFPSPIFLIFFPLPLWDMQSYFLMGKECAA